MVLSLHQEGSVLLPEGCARKGCRFGPPCTGEDPVHYQMHQADEFVVQLKLLMSHMNAEAFTFVSSFCLQDKGQALLPSSVQWSRILLDMFEKGSFVEWAYFVITTRTGFRQERTSQPLAFFCPRSWLLLLRSEAIPDRALPVLPFLHCRWSDQPSVGPAGCRVLFGPRHIGILAYPWEAPVEIELQDGTRRWVLPFNAPVAGRERPVGVTMGSRAGKMNQARTTHRSGLLAILKYGREVGEPKTLEDVRCRTGTLLCSFRSHAGEQHGHAAPAHGLQGRGGPGPRDVDAVGSVRRDRLAFKLNDSSSDGDYISSETGCLSLEPFCCSE